MQTPLPNLSLCGICVAEDELVKKREEFWRTFDHNMDVMSQNSDEGGLEELQARSKTPPKVKPNIRDQKVFATQFEQSNRDHVVYYTKPVMDGFLDLLDDLDFLHKKNKGASILTRFPDGEWSTRVGELEALIKEIPNPYSRKTMQDRYNSLLQRAKKVPNERAHSYLVIKSAI